MKYRKLGRTGMRVSVVGVGTWQLGGEWGKTLEQTEVDAMRGKAADLGINLIDTAECRSGGPAVRKRRPSTGCALVSRAVDLAVLMVSFALHDSSHSGDWKSAGSANLA